MTNAQFEAMYTEYSRLVYNLALQYVLTAEDAQDITQEVFVKLFQRFHLYDPATASLKTWIYRITIHHCLDFLKAKKSKKRFGFIVSLFQSSNHEPITSAIDFDHPGVALEDKEAVKKLFGYIGQLPDNQRTALILTKIEQRSQKEVADIMDISVKAVESLLQRAKQSLEKMRGRGEGTG